MDPSINDAEAALIHIHARSLAAAQVEALGAFNADDVAEDAVRLFRATKAEIVAENEMADRVMARIEARISQTVTPPAGVQVAP